MGHSPLGPRGIGRRRPRQRCDRRGTPAQTSHSKLTAKTGRVAPMELTRADGSPLRVLVVDDEVNIAELIAMALRYEGWEVSTAHTGSKAVSTAKIFKPDAVVLDM